MNHFLRIGTSPAFAYYVYSMKSLSVIILVCSLALVTTVWAEGNSIRGVVVDGKNKPVAGAEIRAERTDSKGPAVAATTDAKGQYALNHLPLGTYKVIASVNKTPGSAATIKTSAAGWVRVDFAMRDAFGRQQHRDQSATERIQGQDMRRMIQDQGFGH